MDEMIKDNALEQPDFKEEAFSQEQKDTTPDAPKDTAFLEVKFNKEIKKLTLEEATTLAQKGMKLDQISEELDILQSLSREKGVGLREFVKGLRGETTDSGADELKAQGFEITEEAVLKEVKRAAETSGKGLAYEYLLYEYRKNQAEQNEAARQEKSRELSLGSLSAGGSKNTADAEFLRGVWGN